ncbi:protocatechuate 3,4-dioxygenase subunit alpha (plasmid) [Mycolicibacterium rufum]|uniref:Protocatechuate 3,4-dioxygenase subunit alpha n=2 Tax=Mycolicibacterium rufum TaxID=318424 RepID=A0ABY5TX54_9MYCO|nr:hypothetical protein [Mycolicibacterium rufum]KGI65914.1 hypothetical protein EU78_29100 [Mycolicibacterium rufum]UVY95971.1 protocatechuate 3,4-dioxygenase subunit alpha [Mycolicibacterium rufum]
MSTKLAATPGQPSGPNGGCAPSFERRADPVQPGSSPAIQFHGVVTGGDGRGVPDALVEIWHAHANGIAPAKSGSLLRYIGWPGTGDGRAITDEQGCFSISMAPPQPSTPGAAPFVLVTILAPARLNRLITRAYHPGCHLAKDPLLRSLPAERRQTLIATRDRLGLRFDIGLRSNNETAETVFLAPSEASR